MPKVQPAQDQSLLGSVFSNLIRARNCVTRQTAAVVNTACQYVTSPEYRKRTHDSVRRFHNERPLLTVFLAIQIALASVPLLLFLGYVLSTAVVGFGAALVFLLFWTSIGLFFFGCALLVTGSIGASLFISFIVFQRAVQLLNALTSTLSQGAQPSQKQEEREEPLPKAEKILRIVDVKHEDWQNGTQEEKVNGDKEFVSLSTSNNKLKDIVEAAKVEANPHVWWTIPHLRSNKSRRLSPWAVVAIACAEDLISVPYRPQRSTPTSSLFPLLYGMLPKTTGGPWKQLEYVQQRASVYEEIFGRALDKFSDIEPAMSLKHAKFCTERRELRSLVADLKHLIYGGEVIPETDNQAVSDMKTTSLRDGEILTTDRVLQLLDNRKTGPLKHKGWVGCCHESLAGNLQSDGYQFFWIGMEKIAPCKEGSQSSLERANREKAINERINAYIRSQPTAPARSAYEPKVTEKPLPKPLLTVGDLVAAIQARSTADISEATKKPLPKTYRAAGEALAAVQAKGQGRESEFREMCDKAHRMRDTAAILRLKKEDPDGPYSSISIDETMLCLDIRCLDIPEFDRLRVTTLKDWLSCVVDANKDIKTWRELLEEMKTMEAYKDHVEECDEFLGLMEHHRKLVTACARWVEAEEKATSNAEVKVEAEGPKGKGKRKVKDPAPAQDHDDILATAYRKHAEDLDAWKERAKERYLASKAAASATSGSGTGAEAREEGSSSKSALAGPSSLTPDGGGKRDVVKDSALVSIAREIRESGSPIVIPSLDLGVTVQELDTTREVDQADQSASLARLRALSNEDGIGMDFLKGYEALSKGDRRYLLSCHARELASFQDLLQSAKTPLDLKAQLTADWRDWELKLVREPIAAARDFRFLTRASGKGSSSSSKSGALTVPGPSRRSPVVEDNTSTPTPIPTAKETPDDPTADQSTSFKRLVRTTAQQKWGIGEHEEDQLDSFERLRALADANGIGLTFSKGFAMFSEDERHTILSVHTVSLVGLQSRLQRSEPGLEAQQLMAIWRDREMKLVRWIATSRGTRRGHGANEGSSSRFGAVVEDILRLSVTTGTEGDQGHSSGSAATSGTVAAAAAAANEGSSSSTLLAGPSQSLGTCKKAVVEDILLSGTTTTTTTEEEDQGHHAFDKMRSLAQEMGILQAFDEGFEWLRKNTPDALRFHVVVLAYLLEDELGWKTAEQRAFATCQAEESMKVIASAAAHNAHNIPGQGADDAAAATSGPAVTVEAAAAATADEGSSSSPLISTRQPQNHGPIQPVKDTGTVISENEWHLIERLRCQAELEGFGEAFERGFEKYREGDPTLTRTAAKEIDFLRTTQGLLAPLELMPVARVRESVAVRVFAFVGGVGGAGGASSATDNDDENDDVVGNDGDSSSSDSSDGGVPLGPDSDDDQPDAAGAVNDDDDYDEDEDIVGDDSASSSSDESGGGAALYPN
ncbi:hypothetical protein B0T09DRAFT_394591 [Sordaria sp. MPI-SDFR-AT-0083]|nr:hypothetical protein B0T09DRAFT_394591 [Sordaria sp. MPI-SDFR-AT-0083]